jgi:nucleoside-diphosphate-sugar epimerase
MRLLVTGAAGFLGAAVVKCARERGLNVVATSRSGAGHEHADFSQPMQVEALLDRVQPDAIVNCAAAVDFQSRELGPLFAVNTLAPALLGRWAAQSRAYLLQVSTTLVHGVRRTAIDPWTPVEPDTAYGHSKALAEGMIRASACSAGILRLGGIFGIEGPSHLYLNQALRAAARGELPTLVGSGTARRNYIHVDDAAAAALALVEMRTEGTFTLGGAEVLTVGEMLQAVCDEYLPGQRPLGREGMESQDQIVVSSPEVRQGGPFRRAISRERLQAGTSIG